MKFIVIILAFIFFFLYDVNQIKSNVLFLRFLFPAGLGLLLIGTGLFLVSDNTKIADLPLFLQVVFFILAAINLALLVYSLFFAFDFDQSYKEGGKQQLQTNGVYALCRHPGVVFLMFVYIFLSLGLNSLPLLICGFLISALNIAYVIFQDIYVFPKQFENYAEYKKETPFLLIRPGGIQKCVNYVKERL